jgi:hypothetical protein
MSKLEGANALALGQARMARRGIGSPMGRNEIGPYFALGDRVRHHDRYNDDNFDFTEPYERFLKVDDLYPVRRSNASLYFWLVLSTTSGGRCGAGGVFFQSRVSR